MAEQLTTNAKPVDRERALLAAQHLLDAIGADPQDPSLLDTPRRIVDMMEEMTRAEPIDLTTFPNEGYDELVLVREIPFAALCAHHLLPFTGVAHVGYLPGERIVGLSKLARVVKFFARGLQVQERLTMQIANCLEEHLRPKGVGVVLVADHTCMTIRGAEATGSSTVTSALRGLVRSSDKSRAEFFALVEGHR